MATTSPLRQRMIEDMTIRNLSLATQQSYIYAVRKFSRHFGRSPDRLGLEDVRAYQLHLIAQKRSWSHINQTACALRFFYGVTLGRQEAFERMVTGREPEKLPPVLSPEEIARLLEAVAGLRNRVALTTAYAAGLRIGEVCRLKVTSIDSKRMLIHVEGGKGAKDRYAMLSPRLLDILRAYWKRARPRPLEDPELDDHHRIGRPVHPQPRRVDRRHALAVAHFSLPGPARKRLLACLFNLRRCGIECRTMTQETFCKLLLSELDRSAELRARIVLALSSERLK